MKRFDNLDLNHDDERIFHLDADFEFGNTRNNESRIPSNKSLQAANGDVSFKKPNFKVPTYTIPNVVSDNPVSGHGSFRTNNSTYIHKGTTYRGSGNNTRRNSTIAPNSTRPISMGSNALSDIAPTLSSSYSTSGKYIPPFRRSSHGPIGIGLPQNLQTINGKVKNHYIPNIQDKRKIPGDEKNPNNFLSQVNENRIGLSAILLIKQIGFCRERSRKVLNLHKCRFSGFFLRFSYEIYGFNLIFYVLFLCIHSTIYEIFYHYIFDCIRLNKN